MLFVKTKRSQQFLDGAGRINLLERLQEKGLVPIVRSARLHAYEIALLSLDRVKELDRLVAAHTETENDTSYVRGDLFCFEDFALFLLFGETEVGHDEGLRAGIVYTADTLEPQQKLDAFCRNLSEALRSLRPTETALAAGLGDADGRDEWQPVEPRVERGFARFVAAGESAPPTQAAGRGGSEHLRVVSLLEDAETRRLLRRLIEAKADNRTADLLISGNFGGESHAEPLVTRLAEAGLVRRELLISCRKQGRSLFRLPSHDALNVITTSSAVCSECGASIADERVEELIAPTDLASVVLKDGSWMANRLRSLLLEYGLPEQEIAVRQPSGDGEIYAMANVCGEPFLFILRDGDVTHTNARRALDVQAETDASHLVVITTAKLQEDARLRLREHARRRARAGSELEVMLVEGIEAAGAELRHAFERVSQRALAEHLCELDSSLGINFGHMLSMRFRLMQRPAALRDLAASAAGALAGSLREI